MLAGQNSRELTGQTADGLWEKLSRRKIVQWGIAYCVGAWGFLQGLEYVSESFGWPGVLRQVAILALLIGLPIVLVISWYHGDRGAQRVTGAELTILTLLFLLGGGIFWVFDHSVETVPDTSPTAASETPPTVAASALSPARQEAVSAMSIAVLPFVNISTDAENEYFAEGISEEILNALARVPGLSVASRTSSFQFRGQEKIGMPLIAEQLRVRHVLEGSVRKSGDTIRITAQLVDGTTDKELWSEAYERTLTTENVFAIQDEITQAIVQQLSTQMTAGPINAPAVRAADTENLDAYALYLEGRTRRVSHGAENILRSIEALEEAVQIDPGFARAWAVLSADYSVAPGWLAGAAIDRDFLGLARQAAEKAIEIDPRLSLPYAVLAMLAVEQPPDYETAFAEFDKAIERNPIDETIYMWRGEIWRDLGFFDRAIADFGHCLLINPDHDNCREHMTVAQVLAGHTDAALDALEANLRRGFIDGSDVAIWGVLADRGNTIVLLYQLNQVAPSLGEGDMRWAVDMLYRALSDPAYDRDKALSVFETRLEGLGVEMSADSFAATNVYFVFRAYERMRPLAGGWWWITTGFPEWAVSPERKRLMQARRLDAYWRKYGFPPQCRPLSEQDFECD